MDNNSLEWMVEITFLASLSIFETARLNVLKSEAGSFSDGHTFGKKSAEIAINSDSSGTLDSSQMITNDHTYTYQ